MAFDIERATYDEHVDELRPFTGKWVLIRGTEIIGIYPTWDEVTEIVDAKFKPGETCIMQIETPIFMWGRAIDEIRAHDWEVA